MAVLRALSVLFNWQCCLRHLIDCSGRTGCLGLSKDIGSQSSVPRHQRVRQLCGTGFANEMHLVCECAAMADLRGYSPDILHAHQTMQQFMWLPDLLQIAKILDAGMQRLQTVNPDEGFNRPGWLN